MSEELKKRFEFCVKFINSSKPGTVKITNEDKLKFYALYKQATVGNCTGKRPGALNIVARYKFDAWKKATDMGLNKESAMQMFIDEFKKLAPKETIAKL